MANMSYCRFQNTYQDLKDCEQELQEHGSTNSLKESLSSEEFRAFKDLVHTCSSIISMAEDNFGFEQDGNYFRDNDGN